MLKNQTSKIDDVENMLCPFTDLYITQGSGEGTHKGTMAVDVRGIESNIKYPYYAPCTLKCIKLYKDNGQVMWQSINNVRCANGYIGIVTIMTAHDNTMDARPGQIVKQGQQLGNMGDIGNTTGVHCHIEIAQGKDISWYKNKYGIYNFNNEVDLDEACFFDNTNILNRTEYLKPKYTETINPIPNKEYINLPPSISKWAVYEIAVSPIKKNAKAYLNPQKFGGLTYLIKDYHDYDTTVEIETLDYGKVKIYIAQTVAEKTNNPKYKNGNY